MNRPEIRRPRRRTIVRVAAFCVLAAGLGAAAFPVASGWTEPPVASRAGAHHALAGARSVDAGRWAKAALDDAERRLREAEADLRRQELRLLPLRDFRPVREQFRRAERAARRARELAIASRGDLQSFATTAVAYARCVVARTEELYLPSRVGNGARDALRAAKLHLHEAESLIAFEEFGAARLRADEALAHARVTRQRMSEVYDRFLDPALVRQWRGAEGAAVARSKRTGEATIVVNKDRASLDLYHAGQLVERYAVELGQNALEPKRAAGDQATPEGEYRITRARRPGQTRYYKALDLDYPNAQDRERLALSILRGTLPAGSRAGAWIEIHGEGGRGWDWTDGCIALTNDDMDDLFARVGVGTPVTIIAGSGEGGRFSGLARRLGDRSFEDDCADG